MTAPTSALERVIRRTSNRSQQSGPRCELCKAALADEHRHLLDTEALAVLCACQACSLLFSREAASEGRYRLGAATAHPAGCGADEGPRGASRLVTVCDTVW